jgi:hypothetical protein
MKRHTAAERLEYGDAAAARLSAMSAREIAEADGVSTELVAKAMWLSRLYSQADRAALGNEVLEALTPSQLEAVAKLRSHSRNALLRRAAAERLPVRTLRQLVRQHGSQDTGRTVGAAGDLASARRALETYARWDDPTLGRLINGPNGSTIRALAEAGHTLALRLEGGPPSEPA